MKPQSHKFIPAGWYRFFEVIPEGEELDPLETYIYQPYENLESALIDRADTWYDDENEYIGEYELDYEPVDMPPVAWLDRQIRKLVGDRLDLNKEIIFLEEIRGKAAEKEASTPSN